MDAKQELKPFHETALETVEDLFRDIRGFEPAIDAINIACISVLIDVAIDSALPEGVSGKLADAWTGIPHKIRAFGVEDSISWPRSSRSRSISSRLARRPRTRRRARERLGWKRSGNTTTCPHAP